MLMGCENKAALVHFMVSVDSLRKSKAPLIIAPQYTNNVTYYKRYLLKIKYISASRHHQGSKEYK
jgi:hypothetical protein